MQDDEQVFTDLYERHRGAVYALLLGRTSDPSVASDLLQETFLRLWRRLPDVSGLEPGRQRAWLVTVARNLVIDRYRAQATRRATDQVIAQREPRPDPYDHGTAERAVLADQLDQLDRHIVELPEAQRVVLSMHVVADMNSQEIADALDLPAGTVRSRLHAARVRLAAALEPEPESR